MGHLPALFRDPLRFLDGLPAHGDLVEIRLGPRPAYLLCHPDLAHQVLTDLRTFDRGGSLYDASRAALGNGLATCAHADHRRQRLLMQPAFRPESLASYAEVMGREIGALLQRWRPGGTVDVTEEMFRLTTAVAVRTLFGAGVEARTLDELRECLDVFLRGVYTRSLLPFADALPTPGSRRYARALARWRGQVDRIIADRTRSTAEAGAPDDLLGRLLAARDEDGGALDEGELHDQIALLILAGAETTATALSWSLHLLGGHPEAEAALHAEVDAVLGGAAAHPADVERLPWTGAVVAEALRLYPPAWVLPRSTSTATRLAGRELPAGSTVVFSPYVLHRRPEFFPAPDSFRPQRWLDGAADKGAGAGTGRGPYLPFGAGATKCIGATFALTEATLTLASITARLRLRPDSTRPVRPPLRSVLAPRTLPMRITAREGVG